MIASKKPKLFVFFHWSIQRERTVIQAFKALQMQKLQRGRGRERETDREREESDNHSSNWINQSIYLSVYLSFFIQSAMHAVSLTFVQLLYQPVLYICMQLYWVCDVPVLVYEAYWTQTVLNFFQFRISFVFLFLTQRMPLSMHEKLYSRAFLALRQFSYFPRMNKSKVPGSGLPIFIEALAPLPPEPASSSAPSGLI